MPRTSQGGGLPRQPQPHQRPDRRSDPRRPLHLRPRLRHALPFASAGRGGRRRAPRATDRRAHPGGGVHRPAQTSGGGWGYVSAKDGGDFDEGSTTITQVQGLRGCRNAGIPVPKEIIDKAVKYIKKCTGPDGGVRYNLAGGGGGGRPADHRRRHRLPVQRRRLRQRVRPQAAELLPEEPGQHLGNQGFGHWHYAHYYYAQVLYREGGKKWEDYRDKIFAANRVARPAATDRGTKATSARSTPRPST